MGILRNEFMAGFNGVAKYMSAGMLSLATACAVVETVTIPMMINYANTHAEKIDRTKDAEGNEMVTYHLRTVNGAPYTDKVGAPLADNPMKTGLVFAAMAVFLGFGARRKIIAARNLPAAPAPENTP